MVVRLTRDSAIWWLGIVTAVVVGATTTIVADAAAYGISPSWLKWLQLAALILGIISAKMASSPLPGAPPSDYDDD